MTEFLIGCDPELWVRKDGNLVSAYGLIPGTKAEPFKVNGGAVQVDGMALEFNIDPASTFKQFNDNIDSVLNELKKMVGSGYEFDFSPVAAFGKEYIDAQPEEAKELGCDPDFSAYTGAANPKPSGDLGIRTASGHIHIGWTKDQDVNDADHIEACHMMVKQLDSSVGILSRVWDRDTTRSSMYGNFGAYRPKSYGVEYRTPSNVWVGDIRTRRMMFEVSMTAAQKLLEGTRLYEAYLAMNFSHYSVCDMYSEVDYYLARNRIISSRHREDLSLIYDELNVKAAANKPVKVKKPKAVVLDDLILPDALAPGEAEEAMVRWQEDAIRQMQFANAAPAPRRLVIREVQWAVAPAAGQRRAGEF